MSDYCRRNFAGITDLRRICLPLMRAVRALPLGLVHGDLFLEAYADRSGHRLELRTFLREARLVWAARKINLWEHLPPSVGGPPYDQRGLEGEEKARAEGLESTLAQLVESIGSLWEAIAGAA